MTTGPAWEFRRNLRCPPNTVYLRTLENGVVIIESADDMTLAQQADYWVWAKRAQAGE